jgi:hypothetical protein
MAGWKKIVTESAASTITQDTTGTAADATALETARSIGGVSFDGTADIVPTTIVVADTTDTTSYVGLWESATGNLLPKTDAGITYNADTGMLTATGLTGPLTGLASTATALATARAIGGIDFDGTAAITPANITVADTTNTTCSVALFESATGALPPKTDGGLTYNAGTGMLTATGFTGPLTGEASAIADEAVDEDSLSITGDAGVDGEVLSSDGAGGFTWEAAGAGGTVTSVAAGNGLDFITFTTTGSVTMGTPGTATAASSNAVTSTSHTHAVTTTTNGAGTPSTILAADASGDLQLHDLTLTADLVVVGNLDVQGTTTTIDSTVVQITDPVIQLNVLTDQTYYANGPSAIILGDVDAANGAKIINTDAILNFTVLHGDDMGSGALPAGTTTAGATFKDIGFNAAVYAEISEPANVNGKVYFDGTDLYLYVD